VDEVFKVPGSRWILPGVINHGLKRLLPFLIESSVALALAGDESVAGDGIDRSCTPELDSTVCEAGCELAL